jgi:multidrug resistance efflux pump
MTESQPSADNEQEPRKHPESEPAEPAAANAPASAGAGVSARPEAPPAPHRMDPVRKWVLVFGAFCLLLLVWYLLADRFTPFTTQARVHAFVVPIAPQVAGELLSVDVTTNQHVRKGQPLAQIDPARYELAVASAEAQLALTLQGLRASSSAVDAAAAALEAAKANLTKEAQDDVRVRRIDSEAPGAISQRRLEWATASVKEAEANVASAKAGLRKALEQLGPRDESNPQLLAARAALDRATLDLKYTRIVAPADGLVTDLRVDVGNFAQTGQPLMTFIAIGQIWVEADLTENNMGHVKPGDPVDLVFDVWPSEVRRGRIRNITYGVTAAEATSKPGGLPTVQNNRDWLRSAQRFPVLIDLERPEEAAKRGVRVGSQVNVIVYTGDHPILNRMGRWLMRLSSAFSYAY